MEQTYKQTAELNVLLGRELCSIEFNKGDTQQLVVTALYASILELAGDALILIQQARYSGTPILVRSMLEAHVHMRALVRTSDHYSRMLATFIHEEERMCSNALKLNQGLRTTHEIIKQLETKQGKLLTEKKRLKAKGFSPIKIRDAFEFAERSSWYSPIYASLCSHSHNNLNVVAQRHFGSQGDTLNPVFEREWADDEIEKILITLGMIIIDAHKTIIAFFKITATDQIKMVLASISQMINSKSRI